MLQLDNPTPLKASFAVFPDARGIDTLFVAVKATFRLDTPGRLRDQQLPVQPADEYRGEPGHSSLARAGEVHPAKPGTDVLLLGRAWAGQGRAVPVIDCRVRVGPVARTVRVFGERRWRRGMVSARPSAPEPFESVPLVWERAFGGQHARGDGAQVLWEERNPVGCGFRGKRGARELAELAV
ncbi:MAG TPA: DUF2169 domain-containing protein, partial [Thermoanaerobaculia bacterium]